MMNWLTVWLFFGAVCAVATQNRQEWDASNYPNPTADGYVRCNMKSPASVCDPDAILNEAQRYRLNYELNQLESRTRQLNGDNFCSKKGIVGAIAIARHVRGGSDNAVKVMANDMLRRWTLDKQCAKSLVIVLSTEDKKFWVARDARVPVYATEFTDLFNAQKLLFKEGDYQQALHNILEGTWDKSLAKQVPTGTSGDGTSRGEPFRPGPKTPRPQDGGGGGFSPLSMLGKIPLWVWLAIFLVVIPTLCCCCCIYMCCCRGRGGDGHANDRPAPPADEEGGGMPAGGRRAGGGGNPLAGFLSGVGGGAAANAIGNFIRSRGAGGGGRNAGIGGGAYPPGGSAGYQPGVPRDEKTGGGGHGLYPSVEVKDEGGGGGW